MIPSSDLRLFDVYSMSTTTGGYFGLLDEETSKLPIESSYSTRDRLTLPHKSEGRLSTN